MPAGDWDGARELFPSVSLVGMDENFAAEDMGDRVLPIFEVENSLLPIFQVENSVLPVFEVEIPDQEAALRSCGGFTNPGDSSIPVAPIDNFDSVPGPVLQLGPAVLREGDGCDGASDSGDSVASAAPCAFERSSFDGQVVEGYGSPFHEEPYLLQYSDSACGPREQIGRSVLDGGSGMISTSDVVSLQQTGSDAQSEGGSQRSRKIANIITERSKYNQVLMDGLNADWREFVSESPPDNLSFFRQHRREQNILASFDALRRCRLLRMSHNEDFTDPHK